MSDARYTSWPQVKIAGATLADALLPRLVEVVVDHHLHLPDMFSLTFSDDQLDALDTAGIKVGTEMAITAQGLGHEDRVTLLSGEVTALEADYSGVSIQSRVRGYDKSHRLHRGRRTETYQNVKLSDVARAVASRARIPVGTIEDSGSTLDKVAQGNVSDWDFLKGLAREIGFDLLLVNGKLDFRKPSPSSRAPDSGDYDAKNPCQLVFGRDLLEFRPRISAAEQVGGVKVRAWDPATKQVVIGSAEADAPHAELPDDPASLASTFGSPSFLVHDRPHAVQSDLDSVARGVAEQIGSVFAEAEGSATGNPALRAGTPISVGRVADAFAGRYIVTSARHIFNDDGYRTDFTVSGRQDRSLLGLASLGATNGSASMGGPPISGVVVGIVTNNDDPEKLGRVKLKLPWLSDSYETDWSRMVQVGAGPDSGAVFLPEVNDEVLCAFEFGDLRRCYVLGPVHNGKDKPLLGDGLIDAGKVKRRGIVSRMGHSVVLFDADAKSGIALITSDGNLRISLNETTQEIHIHSKGKVTIDTDSGAIALKSGSNLELEAMGSVSIKGQAGVKLQSSAVVEVSGSLIKLN